MTPKVHPQPTPDDSQWFLKENEKEAQEVIYRYNGNESMNLARMYAAVPDEVFHVEDKDQKGRVLKIVPIRVRTHVMQLDKVDTVGQSFEMRVWIQVSNTACLFLNCCSSRQ